MPERPSANVPCLEMAYVLFMDVVAYSTLAMDLQRRVLRKLQETVSATTEFTRSKAADRLINLPTGDGMALVFFHDPEAPVRCALELSRSLHRDHPDINLRMGIHMGPVYRVADINANRNVAGGGINIAQRVMDCGDAGHILVSSAQAEVVSQVSNWSSMLHDVGEAEVKHGVRVHLYNLYSDDAGNSATPKKAQPRAGAEAASATTAPAHDEFEKQLAAQIASVRRKPLGRYIAVAVLVIALGIFVFLFWPSLLNTGPSRLLAQQQGWTVLINDAFTKSPSGQSGFRAHLHEPKEGPDILTTAQSLTALLVLPTAAEYQANIDDAFAFIEARRLTSPYPGWSPIDTDTIVRPNGESSAWIAVAKAYALKSALPRDSKAVETVRRTFLRDLALLASLQNPDGSWSPLAAPPAKGSSRTYTSALSLWAFALAKHTGDKEIDAQTNSAANDAVIDKAVSWLLKNYGSRCGWVANPSRFPQNPDCYFGLTSQTLYILSLAENDSPSLRANPAYAKAERQYLDYLPSGIQFHDASKTTDDDGYVTWNEGSQEKLVPIQAWSFFAYPWTLAELRHLSGAPNLDALARMRAKLKFDRLISNFPKAEAISDSCCTFEIAENLYCSRFILAQNAAEPAPK